MRGTENSARMRKVQTKLATILFALLAVAGCVRSPTSLLPNVRPNLDPKWLDRSGNVRYPDNDGFAASPLPVVLPPGLMIDRFGGDTGHFFSPVDASFAGRSLPSQCETQRYTRYRVIQPLLAWTGKTAPWFDEPGGATQFETDASISSLLAERIIEAVPARTSPPCR